MTKKTFMNFVANGKSDILQLFLDMLAELGAKYCVIGGLAVNAYVEPVVSLDLDIVVTTEDLNNICKKSEEKGFRVEYFAHSVNLTNKNSDLRIHLQTDVRYQEFISRSEQKNVLGYTMNVAVLQDVLRGKVWAYLDATRRRSKRQKDLADIIRLVEEYPELEKELPLSISKEI